MIVAGLVAALLAAATAPAAGQSLPAPAPGCAVIDQTFPRVLPTGGTARHSSGLSVQTFLRGIHVVDYTRDALAEVGDHITALGGAEDLAAHVEAVQVRLRGRP